MEFEFGYQRFKVRLLPLILDSLCEGPHVGVVMISCFIRGYRFVPFDYSKVVIFKRVFILSDIGI